MDIDHTQRRNIQHPLRKDLPIGRRNHYVRPEATHFIDRCCIPYPPILIDGNAQLLGSRFQRRRYQLMPPSCRPVRLCNRANHLVACVHQGPQAGYRELRRPHKKDPHAYSSSTSAVHQVTLDNIHIELTVQVVQLMAQAHSQQSLPSYLAVLSPRVLVGYPHPFRPVGSSLLAWHR